MRKEDVSNLICATEMETMKPRFSETFQRKCICVYVLNMCHNITSLSHSVYGYKQATAITFSHGTLWLFISAPGHQVRAATASQHIRNCLHNECLLNCKNDLLRCFSPHNILLRSRLLSSISSLKLP